MGPWGPMGPPGGPGGAHGDPWAPPEAQGGPWGPMGPPGGPMGGPMGPPHILVSPPGGGPILNFGYPYIIGRPSAPPGTVDTVDGMNSVTPKGFYSKSRKSNIWPCGGAKL